MTQLHHQPDPDGTPMTGPADSHSRSPFPKSHPPSSKTANDILVTDGAAAMQRTILATRGALTVPKAKIDAAMAKDKAGKRRAK